MRRLPLPINTLWDKSPKCTSIHTHTHTLSHTYHLKRRHTAADVVEEISSFSSAGFSWQDAPLKHTHTGGLRWGLTGVLTWATVFAFAYKSLHTHKDAHRQVWMDRCVRRGQLRGKVWVGRCSIKEIDRQKEEDIEKETTSQSLLHFSEDVFKIQ